MVALIDIFELGKYFQLSAVCTMATTRFYDDLTDPGLDRVPGDSLHRKCMETLKAIYSRETPTQDTFMPLVVRFYYYRRETFLINSALPCMEELISEYPSFAMMIFRKVITSDIFSSTEGFIRKFESGAPSRKRA